MDLEKQARRAVDGGRVVKVIFRGGEFFLVESRDRKKSYLVYPGLYCSCPDFLFSVHIRHARPACYHMRAVEIALKEGKYRTWRVDEAESSWEKLFRKIVSGIFL